MTDARIDIPPRQLITSIYGLYARAEHDWLSVAALVRLMEDLGIDATAVRSSVSRLKKRDVLRSMRREGRAGYALSPDTLAILREGDVRIFSRPRATPDDGWLVVVFSVPESERERRHALRAQLVRLGLGTAAPGVWMAPGTLFEEVAKVLERTQLTSYTEFFRSDYLGPGDVAAKMRDWWDLDELEALYTEFHSTYAPVRKRLGGTAPAPDVAFRLYVPMLTAWRRLPYRDPGLPLEYLPSSWKGVAAGELFADLDGILRGPADEHAQLVLHDGGE